VGATSHHEMCVDLLDVVYLRRSRIYQQLADVVADKQEAPDHTTYDGRRHSTQTHSAGVVEGACT